MPGSYARHYPWRVAAGKDPGSSGALGRLSYGAFLLSIVITLTFMLGIATVQSDAGWLAALRLILGAALIAEGVLLLQDWRGARKLLILRLRERWGRGGPRRSVVWGSMSKAIAVLGLVWVCMGCFAF